MSDWQNGAVLIPPFGNFHNNQLIKLRIMPAKICGTLTSQEWCEKFFLLESHYFNLNSTDARPSNDEDLFFSQCASGRYLPNPAF